MGLDIETAHKMMQDRRAGSVVMDSTEWNTSMPSRGLGDTIAKVTHATGIAQTVHAIANAVGVDCGCGKRQDGMNAAHPYKHARAVVVPDDAWISTARLTEDTNRMCSWLPNDIDAVLGIARSGLMPAAQISAILHKPLWSVSTFAKNQNDIMACGGGWRIGGITGVQQSEPSKVLIVDDTTWHGIAMRNVKSLARKRWPKATILASAIYAHPQTLGCLDYAACRYGGIHFLEWNLFNTSHVDPKPNGGMGTDLDGVLCRDFTSQEDDDGEAYLKAMRTMLPLHRPCRLPIPLIATARLEKYRDETEKWLHQSGIKWTRLVMGQWKTKQERDAGYPDSVVDLKVRAIRDVGVRLFVESNEVQAKAIRDTAKISVICPSAGMVFS